MQNKDVDQAGFDVRCTYDPGDFGSDFRRASAICAGLNGLLVGHVAILSRWLG